MQTVREGGRRTRGDAGERRPLVSVVTPTKNSERFLRRCLDSVQGQTWQGPGEIEHIVVDGVSTDGTLAILEEYGDRLEYWISEPDAGIYPAMNKGLALARGELVGILGSDDAYRPDAIGRVVEARRQAPGALGFMGRRSVREADGEGWEIVPALSRGDLARGRFRYNHPACFFTHEAHRELGDFDPAFPITADGDFVLRVLMSRGMRPGTIVEIPHVLTDVEPLGASDVDSLGDVVERLRTWRRIYRKNGVPRGLGALSLALKGTRALRYLVLMRVLGRERYAKVRRGVRDRAS